MIAIILAFLLAISPVQAAYWPFFKKQTITLVNGYAAGNIYDIYSRIFAQHFGKHLPNQPNIIVLNMVGGGSIVAANHVYNTAPKDGTVLGIFAESIGINQLQKDPIVKFDVTQFVYIGRLDQMLTLQIIDKKLNIKTIDDLRNQEILIAGYGPGTPADMIPKLLNEKLGTKFIIVNYRSPLDALLAMETGEVQALSLALFTLQKNRPDWVKDGKVDILFQALVRRSKELPDVVALGELSDDPLIRAQALTGDIGISILAPPGVPQKKVDELRKAFKDTLEDPAFIKDVEKVGLNINYLSGDDLAKLVLQLFSR